MAMKNGIESRVNKGDGKTRYRGAVKVGGKLQRSPWFGSHADARKWRSKALGEIEAGERVVTTTTLREAWAEFLEGAERGTINSRNGRPYSASTLRGYRQSWQRLDKAVGAHKLTEVRRRHLQRLVDQWVADGASASTINNSLDPLRAIYYRALRRDLVAVNPTKGLELPKIDNKRERFATREEAAALIGALPDEDRTIWAAAFYSGLRHGELRALRWSAVSFTSSLYGPHISVTHSWDEHGGQKGPKTAAGVRRVPLVPQLAKELRAHKKRTGRDGEDLVFGNSATVPFAPTTVRRRAQRAWKAQDPPMNPIGLHECRHSFASLMIEAGANAKALSEAMGHKSIAITFDRYGKLMPGGEKEVGRLLGKHLAAKPKKKRKA